MNIVSTGTRYMIYGEDLKTYKELPPYTYTVSFNKMTGFSLIKSEDMEIKEKVYGSYQKKANKIINTFNHLNRNMGVILSGPKGVGKTMFSRILTVKAREKNLPLLLVDTPYPGLSDFISTIKQECIVLFDEFEKNFYAKNSEDNSSPQTSLLSLFDGLDNGKKLFIITCNDVYRLNQYFINRPGRFHYHFSFTNPTPEEVKEYMKDKLDKDIATKYLNEIVGLAELGNFTYDILRAIAFELNQGYPLSETLEDLNIKAERFLSITMKVLLTNGEIFKGNSCVDMFSREERIRLWNGQKSFFVNFLPENLKIKNGKYFLDTDNLEIEKTFDSISECEDNDDRARFEFENSIEIQKILITKKVDDKEERLKYWRPTGEDNWGD